MTPIWTRAKMQEWLTSRLDREGRWKGEGETERLAEDLVKNYATGEGRWRVKPWMERVPRPRPVHVVTRGGMIGIHTDGDEAKANIIAQVLNELESNMAK